MSTHAQFALDVSKDNLVCAWMSSPTRPPVREMTVPRTEAGVRQLLAQVPPEVPWVMEPTGSYSLMVAKIAAAAGRTVLMADAKAARHYLQSRSPRAKTDTIDAKGLALMAMDRTLKPYPIKAEAQEKLDQLLAARRGITEALTRLHLQSRELTHAAGPLQEAVAALRKQQEALERQIEQATKEEPTLAGATALRDVPGIGLLTAATAVSRLAARAFGHPDAFVAFIGWDIRVRDSGKRKGQMGLTKQGDAELRRLFYLAAKSSIRAKGSPFAAQYEREQKKGLKKTAALCAVARKMARVVWSLYTHQARYDPERVYRAIGQPA
jgi:transposase